MRCLVGALFSTFEGLLPGLTAGRERQEKRPVVSTVGVLKIFLEKVLTSHKILLDGGDVDLV
jgi:hypothetical protein